MIKNTEKILINKYNIKDSILVISPYPEKGIKYGSKVCAVAGYTKNTVDSLSGYYKKNGKSTKFVVLTIKLDNKEQLYEEDGVLVWRIFERDNPFSYLSIINAVLKFKNVKDILIGFEFASFGNSLTTAMFPFVQLILRTMGKKITTVLHQVVSDFSLLSGHLGWKKSGIKTLFYNMILRVFLKLLVFSTDNTIVLEEFIKKELVKMIGFEQKINVIPHGIDKQLIIPSKIIARKSLNIQDNEFVLLYFGYLTWYKGADFLIKSLASQKEMAGKKIRLIMAGGDSVTQKTKSHYRDFIDLVYRLAKKSPHITITGFVPETDISKYYSAADLVILPYRTMISSSGPLSFAAGFNKPFILSSPLKGYLESLDFCSSLKEAGLKKEDIMFSLNKKKLVEKIISVMQPNKIILLSKFSSLLAEKRNFIALAPKYAQVIEYNPDELLSPVPSEAFLYQSFACNNIKSLTQ